MADLMCGKEAAAALDFVFAAGGPKGAPEGGLDTGDDRFSEPLLELVDDAKGCHIAAGEEDRFCLRAIDTFRQLFDIVLGYMVHMTKAFLCFE